MSVREIEKLDRLAHRLDSQYRVPGTSIRFGWDTILGLIPGIGDMASFAPSAYLIYKAHSLGARRRTLGKMAVNTGLDATIGSIPVVGDAFDLFFKANNRNIRLLRDELELGHARQAGPAAGTKADYG